jgi:hypothetical protein
VTYPFIEQGDASTKVYTMRCSVNVADYNSAQISLDATMSSAASAGVISLPFPADSAAYYCGDFNHNIASGSLMQFDRVFANIPADRTEQFGGMTSYTFPSVHGSLTGGTQLTITDIDTEIYFGNFRVKLYTTDTIPSISGVVYLNITMNDGVGGDNVNFTGYVNYKGNYSDSGGTYIRVTDFEPRESTVVSGTLTVPSARTLVGVTTNCTAFTDNYFYLPNVTAGISSVEDIPELPVFSVYVNSTNKKTERIYDSQTTPSAADYDAIISSNGYLIIKNEIKRYKGNILERVITKVRAR